MKISSTSQRLQQLMRERNLRQADIIALAAPICEKCGVKLNRNDLSQYVTGKVEPGQRKLYVLGQALNVDEAWLMGYDVPMDKNAGYSSNDPEVVRMAWERGVARSNEILAERQPPIKVEGKQTFEWFRYAAARSGYALTKTFSGWTLQNESGSAELSTEEVIQLINSSADYISFLLEKARKGKEEYEKENE